MVGGKNEVHAADVFLGHSSFSVINQVGNAVQYCTKLYSNIFFILFEICNCYGYF